MKKLLLAAAAAFVCASVVSAGDIKFTNKIWEDDAILQHFYNDEGDKETTHDFPGLKERMIAEYTSERVDAMVKATITFDDHNGSDFGFKGKLNDWYIEFRPLASITLGMHDEIDTNGSYLPIYDGNMGNGNIGDDFVFVYSPAALDGALRLAASAPIGEFDNANVNYVDGEEKDGENDPFVFGLGAIFEQEYFEIGGTIKDVLEGSGDRSYGAYVNLPGLFGNVKELSLFALGLTLDGEGEGDYISVGDLEAGVTGDTLFNFGLQYESDITLAVDALYNFGENGTYDLYAAVLLGMGINEFDVSLWGKTLVDLKDDNEKEKIGFDVGCEFDYALDDQNTVFFGAEAAIYDGCWAFAVPAGWKYTFKN